MHRNNRKSLETNKSGKAKRLVGTLGLVCVVGLFGGCANTAKKDTKSWHNMPTSFTAPPAQAGRVRQSSAADLSKKSAFDKFHDALKLKPKVVQVDDPTSLEMTAKLDGPSIYLVTARMCAEKRQFDAAADNYRRALEIAPGNLDAITGMGHVLQSQGKYDEAIKVYRQALNDHPQDLQLVSSIGSCLLFMNEPAKAIQLFEAVIEQDPANPLYREQLALVLVKQNDEQAAYAQLAAVLPPGQATMSLGRIQARLGDHAKAIDSLESAFQQDASLVEAFDLAQALKSQPVSAITETAPFNRTPVSLQADDQPQDIAMMSGVSEQLIANSMRSQPVAIPSTEARSLESREVEFKKTMNLLNQKLVEAHPQPADRTPLKANREAESIPRFKVDAHKSPFHKIDVSSTLKSILR